MFKQKSHNEAQLPSERKGEKSFVLATEAHQRYLLRSSGDDLQTAISLYIEAIKADPHSSSAYCRLASLLHENGQIGLDAAIRQCTQAVKIAPENANAHMYLGYFLSLSGDYEGAKRHFKTAIKLKPLSSARTRIVLAMTLLERNFDKKKNLLEFSQAMYYIFSGSLLFLFDKASIKMFLKNVADDLSYFKYKIVGEIFEKIHKEKTAYEVYSDALDHTKNSTIFYQKMAKIAIKKNRPSVALQCYQNALKLSNNNVECVIDAIEFVEKYFPDNVDELIDYYTILVAQNPEFARCYYELGHLYLKKDERINAVNAFKLALEYDNDNPFYQNSLAYAYVQLEQYDSAIELYKKALETNPDNEWSAIVAQSLAAIYHQIKGNPEAAISMLQNSLLLTKSKSQIYQAIADVYYDIENTEEAIMYYNAALKDDQNNPKAYARLAMAYWEKDYVEQAIINYSKAIDLDPEYDIAYNNLGVIFLDGLGDANRALSYFETAIDINPNYILAHFNLGRAHEVLGEKIEAANKYQMALNLNKISPEVDDELISEKLYKLFEA